MGVDVLGFNVVAVDFGGAGLGPTGVEVRETGLSAAAADLSNAVPDFVVVDDALGATEADFGAVVLVPAVDIVSGVTAGLVSGAVCVSWLVS